MHDQEGDTPPQYSVVTPVNNARLFDFHQVKRHLRALPVEMVLKVTYLQVSLKSAKTSVETFIGDILPI